jgi:hypothetical protein
MDSINVDDKLVCDDNALVRQTSVDVINQCHCASTRCDSTANADDDDDEDLSEDVDGSDDEEQTSVLLHGDITLAEGEVCVVPDSLEGGIICEGGDTDRDGDRTQSHANVGVQTMAIHNADNIEDNTHRSIARTLLTSICGSATRLTKERVIGSITIVVVVILMVLIEKMSGVELVDEKRIIQDLASQILPSQSSTTAAPPPPPPAS